MKRLSSRPGSINTKNFKSRQPAMRDRRNAIYYFAWGRLQSTASSKVSWFIPSESINLFLWRYNFRWIFGKNEFSGIIVSFRSVIFFRFPLNFVELGSNSSIRFVLYISIVVIIAKIVAWDEVFRVGYWFSIYILFVIVSDYDHINRPFFLVIMSGIC